MVEYHENKVFSVNRQANLFQKNTGKMWLVDKCYTRQVMVDVRFWAKGRKRVEKFENIWGSKMDG